MLQVTSSSIIYLASTHIDFRKGIEAIAAICRTQININPLDGAIFLFYNRAKNAIKVLAYDGQGFWMCSKRLSNGSFIWRKQMRKNIKPQQAQPLTVSQICHRVLLVLINNGTDVKFAEDWRKIPS